MEAGVNVVPFRHENSIRFTHNYKDWVPAEKWGFFLHMYEWCAANLHCKWDIIVSYNRFAPGYVKRYLELHIEDAKQALMAKLKWEDTL